MEKCFGVHLKDASIEFESRVMKITQSIILNNIVTDIIIIGKWRSGLESVECIDNYRKIVRINTPLQRLVAAGFLKMSTVLRKNIALISIFVFHVSILLRLLKSKNIRYVCVHNPELLFIAFVFKCIKRRKIFYSPHELEPHKQALGKAHRLFIRFLEPILIRLTNASVFVVSENIADWYAKEYRIGRPVVVKNAPKLFSSRKTNHFRENFGIKDSSIIALYQGGLTKGRGVEFLLETFKKRVDDNIVIVFMGYGELEDDITNSSLEYGNIFFQPAVGPDTVLEFTASADIGIHLIQNTCLNHYFSLPNKFFEYSMAGLPVIVSNMKEMSELVERYNMGIIVEEKNVYALNIAIDKILESDIKEMKQNARRCAEENSWEVQEVKMINAFKNKLYGK
ncbi:MAG: glycosyltransferase family 4 protein [Bacteroidetes bacterium]|nr:glycosyltransferase family 4 protein [Bacteroidota bacterium]